MFFQFNNPPLDLHLTCVPLRRCCSVLAASPPLGTKSLSPNQGYTGDELRAYEQVVTASYTLASMALDAATLVTVSDTTESYMASARADLKIARKALSDLPSDKFTAPPLNHHNIAGLPGSVIPEGTRCSQQQLPGGLSVTLQVLLAELPAAASVSTTPDAGIDRDSRRYSLVLGFAPPASAPSPIASLLKEHPQADGASQAALSRVGSWAEWNRHGLQSQLELIQGTGSPDKAILQRLSPGQRVLDRPSIRRLVQPFGALLDALNGASAAVAIASGSRPDDSLLLSQVHTIWPLIDQCCH